MTRITTEEEIIYTKISLVILSLMIINALNSTNGIMNILNDKGTMKSVNIHNIKSIECY